MTLFCILLSLYGECHAHKKKMAIRQTCFEVSFHSNVTGIRPMNVEKVLIKVLDRGLDGKKNSYCFLFQIMFIFFVLQQLSENFHIFLSPILCSFNKYVRRVRNTMNKNFSNENFSHCGWNPYNVHYNIIFPFYMNYFLFEKEYFTLFYIIK